MHAGLHVLANLLLLGVCAMPLRRAHAAAAGLRIVPPHALRTARSRSSCPVVLQAKEMPEAAGSVTMAVLEKWMASMSEAPYIDQVRSDPRHLQQPRGAGPTAS